MDEIPVELVAPLYNPATFARRGAVDELLTRLRSDYPLSQAEVPGYDRHWIVTRYADIQYISRNNDLFHNADRSATLTPELGEKLVQQFTDGDYNLFRSLVQLDGEEHRAHRQVLRQALSPAAVAAMEGRVAETVKEELVKLLDGDGTVDFAESIATSYPLHVVMDTIGVPREDHPEMLKLTQWLFSWGDPDLMRPGSDPMDPEQQALTWKIVFDHFDAYFSQLIEQRRVEPRQDLATLIANADMGGQPMAHSRAISYFAILATAGHDSTAHSTAQAMWTLAEEPELFAQLKSDPELIPAFVDEAVRWTTPVKHFVRHATDDCEIDGRRISRGDRLYLSYPSGNRDASVFEDPFTFRLDRGRNRHVAFGHGGHICLGQHLARLEMRLLWQGLFEVLDHVEMAGEGELIASEFVSGPKSVPIKYRLAESCA